MTPELQVAIKDLLLAVLQLAVLVATGYATMWVKANISKKQMELAESVAHITVGAAEQLAAAGKIEYKSKFEEALRRAKAQAAKWGLKLDDDTWEVLLEKFVQEMKIAGEEIKAAPEK